MNKVATVKEPLNQKLKLMVGVPGYVIYLTRPLTLEPVEVKVWMGIGIEYSTFYEGWLTFEYLLSRWVLIPCQGIISTKNLS